jgi:hypothetical protein
MRNAYNRRPEDFTRRILKIIQTSWHDTLLEEKRWLDMIKDEELGQKYYNKAKILHVSVSEPWNKGKSGSNYGKGRKQSEEHIKNRSLALKGRKSPNKGKSMSEESKRKLSESRKALNIKNTEEHKEKIRQTLTGRKHSEETKAKMRGRTPWNFGIPHSEGHRNNLKMAWQQRKATDLREGTLI